MSSRAAWRLEALGFTQVYAYHPGKSDWLASGLPTEGRRARDARVDDVAHQGVPTCLIGETVRAVQARLSASGFDTCVVINAQRVVLGGIRAKALEGQPPDTPVEVVMDPAPSTYRPSVSLEEMAEQLQKMKARTALVTTGEGVLIGLVRRDEVERGAHGQSHQQSA
jgi:predicted transcriptional regulator